MKREKSNTNCQKTPAANENGLVVVSQPKFRVITCDNPWDVNQRGNYGAIKHYDLMTQEELKNMPVADLCEDNAVCFMWIVGGAAGRKAGEEVMKAWGFEYKDDFIWVKPQMALGKIIRHAHETVMIGTRGKIDPAFKGQPSWEFLPRGEHSVKPTEFYAIVERMFPCDRYLELFARKRTTHKDWYIWGNEAEGGSDIYIPGYPVPAYSDKVHFAKPDDLEEEA